MLNLINLNNVIPQDSSTSIYCSDKYNLLNNNLICGSTQVLFRGLKQHLIELIEGAELVIGCVAWLTDFDILDALAKTECHIIVQKEDFLRPDNGVSYGADWKKQVQKKYAKLKYSDITRYAVSGLSNLSVCSDPSIEAIRCVGVSQESRSQVKPRMHNKFFVFLKRKYPSLVVFGDNGSPRFEVTDFNSAFTPYAIWTGSYNPSINATKSLENAIVICDEAICKAYIAEWAQITSISEQLNWFSDWCEPEWRVGT